MAVLACCCTIRENEETKMITEDSTESKDPNIEQKDMNDIEMEEERNSAEDQNNIGQNKCAKTSKTSKNQQRMTSITLTTSQMK